MSKMSTTCFVLIASVLACGGWTRQARGLTISPTTAELTVGGSIQFNAGGASNSDVTWSVTDPEVGSISSSGSFRALSEGRCQIVAMDAEGTATTDWVTVASFEVSLPEGNVIIPTGTTLLPVVIDRNQADREFYGFEISIVMVGDGIEFVGARSAQTMSAAWGEPAYHEQDGRIRIAHAGTTPLSGNGTLVNLEFASTPEVEEGAMIAFAFESARFGEGTPTALTQDGHIRLVDDPEGVLGVSVVPGEVTLAAGDRYRFDALVDTPGDSTVTWDVTEGSVGGSIDADGIYRAPKDVSAETVVHVRATSVHNPSVAGIATVTLQPAQPAPLLRISAFENPARSRLVQVLISANEALTGPPTVQAGGTPVSMSAVGTGQLLWAGHFSVDDGQNSITVEASGEGSSSSGAATVSLQFQTRE